MQILKENVKEDIINSAIQEFIKNGYKQTSMSVIAKGAGVSVGNLYRYFKNKEQLLQYILQPVAEDINVFLNNISFEAVQSADKAFLLKLVDQFVNMCEKYKARFNILINDSNESISLTFRAQLTQIALKKSNDWAFPTDVSRQTDKVLKQTIITSWITGISQLVNQYYNEPVKLKKALNTYCLVVMGGLALPQNHFLERT